MQTLTTKTKALLIISILSLRHESALRTFLFERCQKLPLPWTSAMPTAFSKKRIRSIKDVRGLGCCNVTFAFRSEEVKSIRILWWDVAVATDSFCSKKPMLARRSRLFWGSSFYFMRRFCLQTQLHNDLSHTGTTWKSPCLAR